MDLDSTLLGLNAGKKRIIGNYYKEGFEIDLNGEHLEQLLR